MGAGGPGSEKAGGALKGSFWTGCGGAIALDFGSFGVSSKLLDSRFSSDGLAFLAGGSPFSVDPSICLTKAIGRNFVLDFWSIFRDIFCCRSFDFLASWASFI